MTRRVLRRALVVTVAMALLAMSGCGNNVGGSSSPDQVTVSEIVSDPDRYYGQHVLIEAEVSRQIDHRVWEMADGRLFAIYDRGFSEDAPSPGDTLRLEGSPAPLERKTIEADLGVNIEDRFYSESFLDDDVAFVAERVERLNG